MSRRLMLRNKKKSPVPSNIRIVEWVGNATKVKNNGFVTPIIQSSVHKVVLDVSIKQYSSNASGILVCTYDNRNDFSYPVAFTDNANGGYFNGIPSISQATDGFVTVEYAKINTYAGERGRLAFIGYVNTVYITLSELKSALVYDNNQNLIGHFVGAYNIDTNEIGLWDYVTQSFYPGIGNLIKGADV